jgi:molybdopterin converting factor small subunit
MVAGSMKIDVRLFGAEAAAAGASSITVAIESGDSCAALRERISAKHPALGPLLKTARFAINSEFVSLDHLVHAGDEVALIGMVSGG